MFLVKTMDHSIGTIGPTRIAAVGRGIVIDIVAHHPRINAALWRSAMQEEAMLRERIVNRVPQRFRRDQLLTLEHRRLTLCNGGRLEAIAGFTPNYLQLNSTPAEVIRYLDERESARAGPGTLEDI